MSYFLLYLEEHKDHKYIPFILSETSQSENSAIWEIDPLKPNSILNIFLVTLNIYIMSIFSLNIYGYLKYQ